MLKSAHGTRAASFSAKIRNLQEYHNRLLNGLSPPSSSVDIINVLKFFSQALLTILRDIPCLPIDLIRDPSRDSFRISQYFPNLDYRNLYHTLAQFMDSFPIIQSTLATSAPAVFEYLLHALVCLMPFLEHELMDSMPMTVACTISLSFVSQQDIIDMLCYNILPFTLYHDHLPSRVHSTTATATTTTTTAANTSGGGPSTSAATLSATTSIESTTTTIIGGQSSSFDHTSGFASASIPSILMTVLGHTDSLSLHSQLLECLMRHKKDIIQDLLIVIAYGTGKARHAAVELLFQYWPELNPSTLDRRNLAEKHVPWKPLTCQNKTCQNTLNNEAVKICFVQIDANLNTQSMFNQPTSDCKGRPPVPLLICIECAEMVREQTSVVKSKCQDVLLNVLHPMNEISYTCESKNCLSASTCKHPSIPSPAMMAVVTCYSLECTSFNLNKPIRLCATCHASRHYQSQSNQYHPHHHSQAQHLLTAPSTSTSATTTTTRGKQIADQRNISRHLVQERLQSLWHLPRDAQLHFSEAVIALLREASVYAEKSAKDGNTGNKDGSGKDGTSGKDGGNQARAGGVGGTGGGMGGNFGGTGIGGGGFGGTSGTIGSGGFDGGTPGGGGGMHGGIGGGVGQVGSETVYDSTVEERQLLSRYGIWLLIGLCDPAEANTTDRMELLGRMLAMLCQWFHNTACLPDDQAGSSLERIKSESIQGWLMKVIHTQFQLFANCLVPNPPEYAQIGGYWDHWPSMTIQIKEGFKRLLCLVPYDIITADIWAYIMPFWMECFRYDLAESELTELKILLSKVLDPDLSPLGLPPKQMYQFISICFENLIPIEQEQALSWLQFLTLLEIPIPISLLNSMFLRGIQSFIQLRELKEGKRTIDSGQFDQTTIAVAAAAMAAAASSVKSISSPKSKIDQSNTMTTTTTMMATTTTTTETTTITVDNNNDDDHHHGGGGGGGDCSSSSETATKLVMSSISLENILESQLACFVLMMDILLKQFELQEVNAHKGFDKGKDAKNTIQLLYEMISIAACTTAVGQVHTCNDYCSTAVGIELGIEQFSPQPPSQPPTSATVSTGAAHTAGIHRQVNKSSGILNECFFCELCSVWYQLSLQLITYFAPLVEITIMTDVVENFATTTTTMVEIKTTTTTTSRQQQQQPSSTLSPVNSIHSTDNVGCSTAAVATTTSFSSTTTISPPETRETTTLTTTITTTTTSTNVLYAINEDQTNNHQQILSSTLPPPPPPPPLLPMPQSMIQRSKQSSSSSSNPTTEHTYVNVQSLLLSSSSSLTTTAAAAATSKCHTTQSSYTQQSTSAVPPPPSHLPSPPPPPVPPLNSIPPPSSSISTQSAPELAAPAIGYNNNNSMIVENDNGTSGGDKSIPGTSSTTTATTFMANIGNCFETNVPTDEELNKLDPEQMIESCEMDQTEKLTLKFLQELELQSDPDVIYHLLQCIKLLILHAGVLNRMAVDEKRRAFFHWFQKRYLINTYWRLLQAEFSQISQICVPLLLYSITLPGGLTVFSRIINADFHHQDWCVRFAAIERVASFSQFIEQTTVKNCATLQSALSSIIIHMVQALDDIHSAVSQRSLLCLELMRASSLKLYVWCLEIQFDLVIVDRCLVLQTLLQMFNQLSERRVLSWDFFLNRFDTLFLESQVFIQRANATAANATGNTTGGIGNTSTGSIGGGVGGSGGVGIDDSNCDLASCEPTRDLRNTNIHSETYKKKIARAYEALAQTHLGRSLLLNHERSSKSHESRSKLSSAIFNIGGGSGRHSGNGGGGDGGSGGGDHHLDADDNSSMFGTNSLKRRFIAPQQHSKESQRMMMTTNSGGSGGGGVGGLGSSEGSRDKLSRMTGNVVPNTGTISGTSSAAVNRKSSKLAALTGSAFPNNFFQEGGAQSKQAALQEELHLFNVVHRTLDEDFCDQETLHLLIYLFMQFFSCPGTQHPIDDKSLNRTQIIVLRHLNTLLGYSMSENQFFHSAYDLRRKSIFSAFLSGLPDVLDQNMPAGNLLLPIAFPLMVYCPASHRFVYTSDIDTLMPNYSLWLLQSHLRLSWLSSLIVILYKHNYTASPYGKFIHLLIQIVLNTLESALEHRCSPTVPLLRNSKEIEMENKTDSITEEVIDDIFSGSSEVQQQQQPQQPQIASNEMVIDTDNEIITMTVPPKTVTTKDQQKSNIAHRKNEMMQSSKEITIDIDVHCNGDGVGANDVDDVEDVHYHNKSDDIKSTTTKQQKTTKNCLQFSTLDGDQVVGSLIKKENDDDDNGGDNDDDDDATMKKMNNNEQQQQQQKIATKLSKSNRLKSSHQMISNDDSSNSNSSNNNNAALASTTSISDDISSSAPVVKYRTLQQSSTTTSGSNITQSTSDITTTNTITDESLCKVTSLGEESLCSSSENSSLLFTLDQPPPPPLPTSPLVTMVCCTSDCHSVPCNHLVANCGGDATTTSDNTSTTTTTGDDIPLMQCAACELAKIANTATAATTTTTTTSIPPPIERLLPIGGELSDSVRQCIIRRPLPSVISNVVVSGTVGGGGGAVPGSVGSHTAKPLQQQQPQQQPINQCCCCCQPLSSSSLSSSSSSFATTTAATAVPTSSNVYCANFQQTIDQFKAQHTAAVRELSRERLLPIGPKPVPKTPPTNTTTSTRFPFTHQHSSNLVNNETSSTNQSSGKTYQLIRQHTTIGTSTAANVLQKQHSRMVEKMAKNSPPPNLLPSKSVDSIVPEKLLKSKMKHNQLKKQSKYNHSNTAPIAPTIATSSSISSVAHKQQQQQRSKAHKSSTPTKVIRSGGGGGTNTSNESIESLIKSSQPVTQMINGGESSIAKQHNTDIGVTTTTLSESDQETNRSIGSGKSVSRLTNGGGGGGDSDGSGGGTGKNVKYLRKKMDTMITNGVGDSKTTNKKKKKSSLKSKSSSSNKSSIFSTNNEKKSRHHHHYHHHHHHHNQLEKSTTTTIKHSHHTGSTITTGSHNSEDIFTNHDAGGGGGGGGGGRESSNLMINGDNDICVNDDGTGGGDGDVYKRTVPPPPPAADTTQTQTHRSNDASASSQSELFNNIWEMCTICGMPIEKFDEQELGMCLVSLATFVHRDPSLAAPMLPQILRVTSRYAIRRVFPWQLESNVHLPANTASIARQFIRCILHQLSSNGIFKQIFQSHHSDVILFRSIAISLADFVDLNQVTPLKDLFETLIEEKHLQPLPQTLHLLSNVANYFECVFVDYNTSQGCNFALSGLSPLVCSLIGASGPVMGASIVANQPWADLMSPMETYLRRLSVGLNTLAPSIHNLLPVMRVLLALFKIPGIGAHRSVLDPVNKILAHIIQHSPILLEHVRELCILCSRAYVRDRERLYVARTFALELVQALRFRTHLPDENLLLLVQWALEDSGGSLPYSIAAQSLERTQDKTLGHIGISVELSSTNATEAVRIHMNDLLDFIGDVHALTKIKSNFHGTNVQLNEETIGGHLKAGIAQFVALELTRTSSSDHRSITKHLPWLYTLPSLQQGPKEFLECISHVRLLSWLLLGSLQHTALMKVHPNQTTCLVSQPLPLEASTHIAEHVQAILAGFAEQSKASVLHMSALFYAFLLCQLWTVYCEQLAGQNPPGSDAAHQNILVLSDFWSKVTPGVLQLICHSKGLADTVSLHFLSLMETLMECNSEILARLIPLWLPLFNSYQGQLSCAIRVRLQTIISWPCPVQTRDDAMMISTTLIRWLQRIQAKMSQIEMQSSTAIQFYCI